MEHLSYEKLLGLHVFAMRDCWHESYYGVSNPGLLQSALARPLHASHYEAADGLRQAAYLFHGLMMNHGFVQGNKRTAWLSLRWFLRLNQIAEITASKQAIIDMCFRCENEKWTVDQVDAWLRANTAPLPAGFEQAPDPAP